MADMNKKFMDFMLKYGSPEEFYTDTFKPTPSPYHVPQTPAQTPDWWHAPETNGKTMIVENTTSAPIPLGLLMNTHKHLSPGKRAGIRRALSRAGVSDEDIDYVMDERPVDALSGVTNNPAWITPDGGFVITPEFEKQMKQLADWARYKALGINSSKDVDSFLEGAGYVKPVYYPGGDYGAND